MKCLVWITVALTILANCVNAMNSNYAGESFADAIISLLKVEACKFGGKVISEPPPTGLRCNYQNVNLIAEFLDPETKYVKVLSCIHINTQQALQIRSTIDSIVKEVLAGGKVVSADFIVGTRTPVKVSLSGYPNYIEYPKRYIMLSDLKDLQLQPETIKSVAHDLSMGKKYRQSAQGGSVGLAAEGVNTPTHLSTCSAIARLQQKAAGGKYLPAVKNTTPPNGSSYDEWKEEIVKLQKGADQSKDCIPLKKPTGCLWRKKRRDSTDYYKPPNSKLSTIKSRNNSISGLKKRFSRKKAPETGSKLIDEAIR